MSLATGHSIRMEAGVSFDWKRFPPRLETLAGVPGDAVELYFRREKSSHRGIAALKGLKRLWVHKVNQEFLGEIAELPDLEMLYIGSTTATSFGPLNRLGRLRRLIVIGGTKIESLDWVAGLPASLEVLFLEAFKRVPDLGPLARLTDLTALGFEGGIDTRVKIDSLEPLAALRKLRYLFLANAQVQDKSLAALRSIASLERLECSIHFPDREFVELRRSLPKLKCNWIDMIDEHGSLKAGMAAFMKRMQGR